MAGFGKKFENRLKTENAAPSETLVLVSGRTTESDKVDPFE